MDAFRFCLRQPVTLRDLDGFGHVNNAVYLTYIENGRVGYLREVVGARRLDEIRNIMASATLEYRASATYPDVMMIGVRISEVGTKSFVMEYKISAEDGRLLVEARSVQVMYDYEDETSIPVPEEWRQRIETFEGFVAEANADSAGEYGGPEGNP